MVIPVERRLEIVTEQIIRAKLFYDIWWFYKGNETRPHIIDTLNNFSEFFRYDEHAHFVSMIVHCAVVWDSRSNNISLCTVAKCILDPRRNCADRESVSAIEELRKNASGLVKIRHEAIAHRSGEFDYDEAFRRARVVPASIPVMIEAWLEVANNFRTAKGLPKSEFAELPLVHARRIITKLGGPDLNPSSPLDGLFGS